MGRDFRIQLHNLLRAKTDGVERLASSIGLVWRESKRVWFMGARTVSAFEKARREWHQYLSRRVSEALDRQDEKEWTDIAFDDCTCESRIEQSRKVHCPVHARGAKLCGAAWGAETCARLAGHQEGPHRSASGTIWRIGGRGRVYVRKEN